jgi:virginiamycin B lyase
LPWVFQVLAGDLDYGAGFVLAAAMEVPLTIIDGRTNKVRRQWVGRGGDAVRFGFGSIWMTDYHRGLLWRVPAEATLQS